MKHIFVPLKRKYFELIKQGKKRVELRSENSPVTKQYLSGPELKSEFRCGYRGESLFGSLTLVWVGKRDRVPDIILKSACVTRDELKQLFKPDEKVCAFRIFRRYQAPSR